MDTTKLMRCPACGEQVPSGVYCVSCGALLHPAAGERGGHFAAAPHQHRLVPGAVATLFPRLPRAGQQSFHALLATGALLIVGLALAGLFPLALIAAAVLVPLVVVLYLDEVDVYEGEPLPTLVLTVLWGAGAGVATGFLRRAVLGGASVLAPPTQTSSVLWNGFWLPLIGLALTLVGPLALLRRRRYDDVLDGVVFGAAAAVSFAGAYVLTESSSFLAAGLAPTGLVEPWLVRLLTLGFAVPVLSAAVVGAATGALWLRLRAPRGERAVHRALAHPLLALLLAGAALIGAALLQVYLDRWAALAALAALAAGALLWLRALIHVGLTEERTELEAAGPCPNCGRAVPRRAFCSYCGIATRALPKHGAGHDQARRLRLLARFAAALAVLGAAAVVVLAVVAPSGLRAPCSTRTGCASPPLLTGVAGSSPFITVTQRTWAGSRGLRLTYDPRRWHTVVARGGELELIYGGRLELLVRVAAESDEQQALDAELSMLRSRYPDLTIDGAHPLASVTLGPLAAIGGLYAGHDAVDDTPVEALVEVGSVEGVTVVASAWTSEPPQASPRGIVTPFALLSNVDAVLETLHWPAQARHSGRL